MVAFELAWCFVLMILWVVTAGLTVDALPIAVRCDFPDVCEEYQTLQAFGWLAWLTALGWFVFLIIAAAISHTRGNTGVWTQFVTETDFFAYKNSEQVPQQQDNSQAPQKSSYTPQAHQQA